MADLGNLERLQRIVGEQLGIDTDKIRPDADFGKELGADSLDVVELVMSIEYEFDIDIEDKAASKIATVQDALNYMEGKSDKS
jgi:acyl carrier protein